MARHRDSRSSSPTGSTYSSSKRPRRDDDRYDRQRRDDDRGYRRRSRSRDADVSVPSEMWLAQHKFNHRFQRRYRDRDPHRRRERSIDRRDDRGDDKYRSNRRERSRDKYRDDRDRRRSRDRDHRSRRDDSRDRARRHRDGSTDSRYKNRRDDSRERRTEKPPVPKSREVRFPDIVQRVGKLTDIQGSKPSTPAPAQVAEDKKAEKLAKLEAWKQKVAAERERKQKEEEAAGGTRGILDKIDQKSAAPAVLSPAPEQAASPAQDGGASPAPYAGKFDPKAIANAKKSASSSTGTALLGTDVAVPESVKASATSSTTGMKADKPTAISSKSKSEFYQVHPSTFRYVANATVPAATSSVPLKARGNLSGFGLGSKAAAETEKSSKRALDFGDEESTRKKLEKLPTPPLEDAKPENEDMAVDAAEDEDEEDVGLETADNEEEAAAAARAAAEKREERLQNEEQAMDVDTTNETTAPTATETNGDTSMIEAPAAEPDEEEEEADALDAFMNGLSEAPTRSTNGLKSLKKKQQEPEAMFGDDEVDLNTIDADPDDILAMASKARKKKDLPAINHAKMDYEPFRRNFYSEPSELADMTEEELADLRLELEGIKIRGVDAPKPVQKWSQCGLGVQTLGVIDKLGYERPSAIQSQAIPAIMAGRDVIGVAKTGSGKTIAFLLPMFRHIKDQRPLDALEGPVGLIMTPTRELATQIHKECKPFLKALNLRAVCAYGGAPIKDQIADLKRGAEIIVCTPGRMIDLLAANSGRVTNLRRVTYTVLDEADRMFDMGFEPQVMKILANIRPDRQTVLFSATFPRQMEALARKTLAQPVEIIVGGRSVVAPEITQIVEVRNDDKKFVRLLELLGNMYSDEKNEDDRALIFVDRQEAADGLLRDLMRKGYPCMSIHGGKDQIDRDSTIDDFKAGVVPIMIATSVAARGLDVKQLKLVVNYDAPNHLEDYVHRAGRTGRAGNTGTAVTFVTEDQERYSVDIAKALRQSGQPVPEPVQKLVDSFLEKIKSGKEKAGGSGFGGKGLERLDQERDAARNRERKTYKTGDDNEEEEKDDKKDVGEDIIAKAASGVQAASAPQPLVGVPKGIDLDGKITVHKTEQPTGTSSKNPLDKVGQAVADIHSRLNKTGQLRSGVPIDNKGPDAGAFHATLEINDFPRKSTSSYPFIPHFLHHPLLAS